MGFLLSYLLCFTCAIFFQYRYSYKKVKTNVAYIFQVSFFFLLGLCIFDTLVIFGVLDGILIYLNYLPFVSLPIQNTGLYYYYNCFLIGFINIGFPINGSPIVILFAIILETTYISVFRNGLGYGRFIFGKKPYQTGVAPFLKPLQKPKNWKEMEAKWEENTAKREKNEEYSDKIIEKWLKRAKELGMQDQITGYRR